MEFTAISDRILIIEDPIMALQEKSPNTGTIHSIGDACSQEGLTVNEGDRVVFARGNHPQQGEYKIIRESQLYAIIP